MSNFEHDKRVVVYPAYINSKNSVAAGRRIPLSQACENPTVFEILDCCKHLNLPADIEDKQYPREWWIRGRVRVQLKNEDGTAINPEITTRRALFVRVAELVPKHPGRGKKAQAQAALLAKQQAAAAAAAASNSNNPSSSKPAAKGGGKKKNRK